MVTRSGPLALALACAALFAAGCGGDDEKSTDAGSDAPVSSVSTSEPSVETTATEPEDTGGSVADDPRVKEAIENCKQQAEDNPSINDDIVDDIKAICDRAASGDPEDLKDIAKEVCLKVIESSGLEGDVAEQAKQSCETAG